MDLRLRTRTAEDDDGDLLVANPNHGVMFDGSSDEEDESADEEAPEAQKEAAAA